MSVGVLPHVKDPRSLEQIFDDYTADLKVRAVESRRPAIEAVASTLAELLPAFRVLDAEDQFVIAAAAVEAAEAGW